MRRLAQLPGWLLAVVWVAVPALAIALVVASVRSDADPATNPGLLGTTGVDVQTADLQRLRAEQGIADCADLPVGAAKVEDGLPSVALPCLGGAGRVDLASLVGPLVVNVWAETCGPCRAEMPLFQRLHESATGVTVVGIDYLDLQPDRALDFAGEVGVTYPSLADVDDAMRAPLDLVGLPTTLFVDASGRLVAQEARAYDSYAELAAAVEQHLGLAA